MTQRFPEIPARLLTLLLLVCCTTIAAGQSEVARFNPFTDHHALPHSITWLIQVEQPSSQIDSEQAKALSAAIEQTDLFVESSRAWSRLSKALGGKAILGTRAQFIAGSKINGLPWAIVLEIEPRQRRDLVSKLNAVPEFHRNKRPVSMLEDGRYLLTIFDRNDHAYVLLAPRADRNLKPTQDPKAVLFFGMFDLLAADALPESIADPNPLAAPIKHAGPGEFIIARLGTDLKATTRSDPASNSGTNSTGSGGVTVEDNDSVIDLRTGSTKQGFVVVRLDRSAGGWSGQLVMTSTSTPDKLANSSLPDEHLAGALSTISWVTLSEDTAKLHPALFAEYASLSGLIPASSKSARYLALIDPDPANTDAKPALALVQRVDATDGPAEVDAALASMLAMVKPDPDFPQRPEPSAPNHHGRFPTAARVQTINSASILGPRVQVAWRFSPPVGQTRIMALVIAREPESAAPDAEAMVNTLLRASANAPEDVVKSTAAGNLRLAQLSTLYHKAVPSDHPTLPLLTRIESVSWSLSPTRVGPQRAVQGPVEVILTPTRRGELGTK